MYAHRESRTLVAWSLLLKLMPSPKSVMTVKVVKKKASLRSMANHLLFQKEKKKKKKKKRKELKKSPSTSKAVTLLKAKKAVL